MTRDRSLERTLRDDLADEEHLTGAGLFGGWAFLIHGHLLACAR